MRELIYFAHGNGFPSPCYTQLLLALNRQYDYEYIDKIGHAVDFPVTENWDYLVEEIIDRVRKQKTHPVIAVGHSLGGILCFCAAVAEPSLFKALVLLDSPILGRFKSNFIRLSKQLGVIDRITPASRTRNRRRSFSSRDEALTYFKSRALFKDFTQQCLEDYVDFGLIKRNEADAYDLRFDSDIEYQIYRTMPHTLHRHEGQLKVPAAIIYGSKTKVLNSQDLHNMKKNYNIKNYKLQGSHMFPMENPVATADLIIKILDDFQK